MRKLNKGSALLITLMVLVVLSLTGLSFIFLADTENAISNNYYKAMSTLVTGQTGVYLVNSWFNTPTRTADLVPTAADMQFNVRTDAENETGADTTWKNSGVALGGLAMVPFDKPYIGADGTASVYNQFFGTEAAPDVVIALGGNGDAYLTGLNTTLFGADSPTRIRSISLYAPPMGPYPNAPTDPRNQAYAICTALVEAQDLNPSGVVVSTRRIRGIITDINYSVAGEALDVDGVIDINGSVRTHWGNIKTTESLEDNNVHFAPPGGPYYVGPTGTVGYCGTMFQYYDSDTSTANWPGTPALNATWLQDPWLLVRSRLNLDYSKHGLQVICPGGTSNALPANVGQALVPPVGMDNPANNPTNVTCDYYFDTADNTLKLKSYYDCTTYACGGTPAVHAPTNWVPGATAGTNSSFTNYWGCDPTVAFATSFRGYNYWKRIISAVATQGGSASQTSHYLVAGGATAVNGKCAAGLWGPPGVSTAGTGDNDCKDFDVWTNDKKGFWFFDTTDGTVPKKDQSNLAPEDAAHGQWSSEGFVYLCSLGFTSTGGNKGSYDINFPGDPLWENPDPALAAYVDGQYTEKITMGTDTVYVDRFLNLEYPPMPYGTSPNDPSPYKVNDAYEDTTRGITKSWDKYGPLVTVDGMFHGIFYVTGDLRGAGNRAFWGSVMVWNGQSRVSGTVDVWYDPKLKEGVTNLGLPNSYIEQILTDM